MPYRAAIIGCGKIGTQFADDPRIHGIYTHAGAYAASPRCQLAGVCDADATRAEKCARRWDVPGVFTDVPKLLAEIRPDLVSLCTPDPTHATLLRTIIESGAVRAILAEKPLALDASEAAALVRLAAGRNILLAVNYSRRYAAGHQRVAELIHGGTIGRIQNITGRYTKGIWHNGSHWFDLARWFLGEVSTVQGFVSHRDFSSDPTLDARLVFASGAQGWLHGCDAGAFTVFEMDIVGSTGRIRLSDSGHVIEVFEAGDSPRYSGYRALRKTGEFDGGLDSVLPNAVEDLVDSLEQSRPPVCTGADGVATLEICAAVQDSAATGRAVTLHGTAL